MNNNYPHWQTCLTQLKTHVSQKEIDVWVLPLQVVYYSGELKLLAPNNYVKSYINKNLLNSIQKIVKELDDSINTVSCEIGSQNIPEKQNNKEIDSKKTHESDVKFQSNRLNTEYTFEKHIEGSSNQLARTAALQVGNNPGEIFNPLFIYGGVGLGKTHLMQAAGHLIQKNNPNFRVDYIGSEMFLNNMVRSLQNNKMADFKRYYRSVDALLIDDIQFFARKDRSQEEFFHTFNSLLEGRRQVIITCDRIPKAIENIEERLISRFGSGLTVSIDPPDLETRIAILAKKAETSGVVLNDDVLHFVANVIRSNVRELEGALQLIIANAKFTGRTVDVYLAKEALRDILIYQEKKISVDSIQQTVAEYFKIRVSDLLSKKRARDIARPRQLAMYYAREYTSLSLPQIGDRFGGRDHTTVIHACKKIEELMTKDVKLQEDHRNLQHTFRL